LAFTGFGQNNNDPFKQKGDPMKQILMLVAMFSLQSLACPGGDIKSLALSDGTVLAQVNLSTDRVKIIEPNSELESLIWSGADQELKFICGAGPDFETCDFDQGLRGVKLTAEPDGILTVQVFRNNESYVFNVTHFAVARGLKSCGATVYPEENNSSK
jgi:hypothetical protein